VVLTIKNPDPVNKRPDPPHWSKPVLDPDPKPRITDPSITSLLDPKTFRFHKTNMC
jgi:hypothetical protein